MSWSVPRTTSCQLYCIQVTTNLKRGTSICFFNESGYETVRDYVQEPGKGGQAVKFRFKREVKAAALLGITNGHKVTVLAAESVPKAVGSDKYQLIVVTSGGIDEHIHVYNGNFDKIQSGGSGQEFFPSALSFVKEDGDKNIFRVFWGDFLFREQTLPSKQVDAIELDTNDGPSKWQWSASRIGCPPHIFFDSKMDAFTRISYRTGFTNANAQLMFSGTNYWRINLAKHEYPCTNGAKTCVSMIPGEENYKKLIKNKVEAAFTLRGKNPNEEFIGLITNQETVFIKNQFTDYIFLDTKNGTIKAFNPISKYIHPSFGGKVEAAFSVWSQKLGANIIVLISCDSFVTAKAVPIDAKDGSEPWTFSRHSHVPRYLFDYFQKIPVSPDAADYDPVTRTFLFFYDNHYVIIKRSDAKWDPDEEPFDGKIKPTPAPKEKRNVDEVEVIEYEYDDTDDIRSEPVEPPSLMIDGYPHGVYHVEYPPPPMMAPVVDNGVQSVDPVPKDGLDREVNLIQGHLFPVEKEFYSRLFPKSTKIRTYEDFVSWRNNFKNPQLDNPVDPRTLPKTVPPKEPLKKRGWMIFLILALIPIVLFVVALIVVFCVRKKKVKAEEPEKSSRTSSKPSATSRDLEKLTSKDLVSSSNPGSVQSSGQKSDAHLSKGSDVTLGKSVPPLATKTPSSAKKDEPQKNSKPFPPTRGRSFGHLSPPPSKKAEKIMAKIDHNPQSMPPKIPMPSR